MGRGRVDYIILLAGEAEKTKIIADSKDLLTDLRSFRDYLCSTAGTQARTPVLATGGCVCRQREVL
jgi:hypothetical protein